MSKLVYKGMIEDSQNDKFSDAEIEAMLAVYESTVKSTSTTPASVARFKLADFAIAKQAGIDRFTLTLERCTDNGQEQWRGIFEHGNRILKIIAILEKN